MLYELRINVFVQNLQDYDDVRDKLNDLEPIMKVISPGEPSQECSFVDLIENHHDENPHSPCPLLNHWDNCP